MKPNKHYQTITIALLVALVIQPFIPLRFLFSSQAPLIPVARAQDAPRDTVQATAAHALYLPLVATKGGPPAFVISAPAAGTTVAGTVSVTVRSTDGQPLTSVSFRAGNTLLANDTTAADGFRAFLNARQFPAGPLTLTATARTTGGESSQSITVNVLPDPPSSGALNTDGSGIFDSQIGSVISLRPGSAPPGTQVSVTELSQEQVTAQHQIDWDAIGVTFLGAQQIESSAPLVEPFAGVSSAGFGNRVQPGQAVVNYRLAPDADGDGISEIVVVNTASIAPNGDVVADPIGTVAILSVNQNTQPVPPGALVSMTVKGFNRFSPQGNLAVFQSLVTNEMVTVPGVVAANQDGTTQKFQIAVPLLPSGPANFYLKNLSNGATTTVQTLTVAPLRALTRPPLETIDLFFTQALSLTQSLPAVTQEAQTEKQVSIRRLTEARAKFQQLSQITGQDAQQTINNMAQMIEGSGVLETNQTTVSSFSECFTESQKNRLEALISISAIVLGTLACTPPMIASPFGMTACAAGFGIASELLKLKLKEYPTCQPKDPCLANQSNNGPTGMGAAPPPGGNGCGGANGGGGGALQAAGLHDSLAGRIAVRVYINGQATPFTGITDAGGYFFVPFIPEGEPFTAIAYDQVSGQRRNFNGVGPKTGESVYLFFDFSTGEDTTNVTWDGEGDGVSWGDPKNWSGDSLPVETSHVTIADAPGRNVLITNSVKIASLRSDASVTLDTPSYLDLLGSSTFNKGVTLRPRSWVTAYGDDTVVTVGGDQLTVANGATLFAYGNRAAFRLTVAGTTLAPGGVLAALGVNATITASGTISLAGGGLYAAGGAQIRLPQATTYRGDIRALDYTSTNVPHDIQDGCDSSISGMSDICAFGADSYIDLSGVTAVDGETWTGFFGSVDYLGIRANEGGKIDLSNLTTINKGRIAALARGSGSVLNLAQLQNAGDRSYFLSVEQGALDIRNLTNLTLATLDIGHLPAVQTSQITNLSNAILYVDQTTPDFANLTNISGSSLYATGGGQIILPQIVDYAGDGRDFFTTFEAKGAGSLIALPALTSLVGNTFVNDALFINVKEGGQIKIPKLPIIASGKVQMSAEQSGSLIDLPLLNTFLRDGRGESWLKALDGGKIATPLLTTLNGISLYFAPNGTLDSAQITDFTNGLVDVTGVTPVLNSMNHVDASSFIAHNGGKISVPQVTSYTAVGDEFFPTLRAEGAGSLVDFSTVTAYTGQTGSGNAYIEAKDGGVVRLNQVAAINTGEVNILAEGANARVDLASLAFLSSNVDGWRDSLTMRNGGVIDRGGNALTVEITDVELDKNGQLLVGPLQLTRNSHLLGNGALTGSVLLQDSTLAPGSNSAGKVAAATYTQAGASTLSIEIGGTQPGVTYDQVAISGNAVLTGTLEISLINGYLPPLNSTFAILTAGAVSGTFPTVTGTAIGNGRKFNVVYNGTAVTLQVVATQ